MTFEKDDELVFYLRFPVGKFGEQASRQPTTSLAGHLAVGGIFLS